MAIMTRCAMPPESLERIGFGTASRVGNADCGKNVDDGCGRFVRIQVLVQRIQTSAICLSTVCTGFSDD